MTSFTPHDAATAAHTAKIAHRPDLADLITASRTFEAIEAPSELLAATVSVTPDTHQREMCQYLLDSGATLWHLAYVTVDRHEGSVWVEYCVTEYDLSDADTLRKVEAVLHAPTGSQYWDPDHNPNHRFYRPQAKQQAQAQAREAEATRQRLIGDLQEHGSHPVPQLGLATY